MTVQRRQSANREKGKNSVRQIITQILRRLRDRGVHGAKRPLIPQKYGEADYLIRAEQNIKQKIYGSR